MKYIGGETFSDTLLINALINAAPDYTAKSYNNLKGTLAFFLKEEKRDELADKVWGLKNHTVKKDYCKKRKKKKKTINVTDRKSIASAIENKKDPSLIAAYILALHLGSRPSEMQHIRQTSDNTFQILGSKKSKSGSRGLDRDVRVHDDLCTHIIWAIKEIKKDTISRVQDRFNYLMKQVFKRKKLKPTIYTLRHQFCSELKSSKTCVLETAYLMGHQSTRTMENYGYANAGSGNIRIRANCSIATIKTVVRDTQKARNEKRISRIQNLKQLNLTSS